MNRLALMVFAAALAWAGCSGSLQHSGGQPELTTYEAEIIDLLNEVRMYPHEYADLLRETVSTASAETDEAMAHLMQVSGQPALTLSSGLSQAAADHVNDIGPAGITGEIGTDGSTLGERLSRYGDYRIAAAQNISYGRTRPGAVVDGFVLDREHRINLLDPMLHRVGIACGNHANFDSMCVVTFAGAYLEDGL